MGEPAGRASTAGPGDGPRAEVATALGEIGRVDLEVCRAVAETPTPTLDGPVRRLSQAANRFRLWIAVAGVMMAVGGTPGRRAAGAGLTAIAIDSAVVNGLVKFAARRPRPDPDAADVPVVRRVPMPGSTSFPSGHSASGFAFANAVGQTLPAAALPLRMLACAVGCSRVHTGVRYPGDVVWGAVIGATVGEAVGWGLWRVHTVPRFRLARGR